MGFRDFLSDSLRVLKLIKKPDKDEFVFVAKVAGAGILLIGFIGFLVDLLGFFLFR